MDQLTNQAIDMIFENDALKDRILKPIKQKAYPLIITGILFNLILLVLLIYIIIKLRQLTSLF